MTRSFGMDTRPSSTVWADIVRGPTKAEVRAHVEKIHNWRKNSK